MTTLEWTSTASGYIISMLEFRVSTGDSRVLMDIVGMCNIRTDYPEMYTIYTHLLHSNINVEKKNQPWNPHTTKRRRFYV